MRPFCNMAIAIAIFMLSEAANAQQAVYPLHKGDRWQYSVQPGTARIDRDSLMPNGQRYALVTFGFGRNQRWERTVGNQVFWYNPQTGQEHLWYDFSLGVGDTVNIIPRATDSTIIYLTGTGTLELFGVTRRWWSFWIDYVTTIIDDEEGVTITDSLGLTYISAMWYSSQLQGAIIDGREYGTITHVASGAESLPPMLHLSQNYPNPFNPSTNFKFTIVNRELTILKVYDLLGREVATLVDEVKEPGTYEATWDASGMASGVYFCRLSAGRYAQTRKLIVVK